MLKGKGVLSELFARHTVLNQFPPKLITHIDTEEESEFNEDIEENIDNLLKNTDYNDYYSI